MIFYASLAIAAGLLMIVIAACAIVDRANSIPRGRFYETYHDFRDDACGDDFSDD